MAYGKSLELAKIKVVPKILSVFEGQNRATRRGRKIRNLKKQRHLSASEVILMFSLKASK